MSIQMYVYKRNFDVQKAERFLKERKVAFQTLDLKKHKLGRREVELFAKGKGVKYIIDLEDEKVKSHPIAYTFDKDQMIDYLLENPQFLKTPVIRMGQKVIIGFDEDELNSMISI